MKSMTQQAQVYSIFIRATPERVWEAITKPEFTRQYFFRSVIDSTFQPGSPYRWSSDRSQQFVDGEVLESDPPRLLRHTWRALYDEDTASEPFSHVTWEIEPTDRGYTKLTVIHDRLDASPKTASSVAGGWMYVLGGLKSLLETGKPLEDGAG